MIAHATAVQVRAPAQTVKLAGRLRFLDNLRVVAMALVIMQHVGQVYGPTLGQWPIPRQVETAFILDPFFTVNRSFGMSLFFMIAGYFAVLACDKKGPAAFLKDRGLRLGIPLLVWTVFMALMQTFLTPTPATGYTRGIPWPVEVAHMWFVQNLLIFSAVYAIGRMLARGKRGGLPKTYEMPPWWTIALFALALALVSAIVRTWYDMDQWVYLLGFVKLQPFDLPRDLSLFVVGMVAARRDWLMRFPSTAGRAWLGVGLMLAAAWYIFRLVAPAGVHLDSMITGAAFTLWESFLCVAMCIGLVILFRDAWSTQSSLMRRAAQAQYATYIFHIGVVLLFQWAFMNLTGSPFAKFLVVSLVTVPVSFLVGYAVSKPLRM